MQRRGSVYFLSALLLGTFTIGPAAGCGKPAADQAAAKHDASSYDGGEEAVAKSAPNAAEAAGVVQEFLQAIKTGDETKSNDLLTPLARQKTSELDMAVAPMGSESASFTVGAVEFPQEGGRELAHVASTWTDIDEDGEAHTDEILWVLRREKEGWRIGGMATQVFADQPPLLLNFEDPADMRRKQQLAEAEMERRARAAAESQPVDSPETDLDGSAVAVPSAEQRQAAKPSGRKRSQ